MCQVAEAAAPKTSSAVAYVFDFGSGSNDVTGPGFGSSIFFNALTGAAPGGSYTTADGAKTVTVTDVPVSTLDSSGTGALAGFDTVIMYEVCDIGSHPAALSAINSYLAGGGKVMLFDADRCAPASGLGGVGLADYSSFLFPFTTSSPGPQGASGSYTNVVPSTLTAGLSTGPQTGDSVGDANIFTSFSGAWCASITGTNFLGANGFVEATARTGSGGLVIYAGEDFWFTKGHTPHLRLVFDDMLEQNWAPDGLPCTVPASGISLSPPSQTQPAGGTASFTGTVVDINGHPVPGVNVSFKVTSGPNTGTTGSGTTDSSGNVPLSYGSTTAGTDNVVASFVDSTGATHSSNPVTVTWQQPTGTDPPITAAAVKFCATEGISTSGNVATFTDPDTGATPAEYAATINWGDGKSSAGTISGSGGKFTVSGTHSYADEGHFRTTVTITDVDNTSNTATVSGTADISDAKLKATGTSVVSPHHFHGTVATFTDANKTTSTKADFKAVINWGDGKSSAGTISGSGGMYSVSGGHIYCHDGRFTITVHIVDDGRRTAGAISKFLIFGTSRGGTFVIGDNSAVLWKTAMFWGASWSKANSLSGGPAPASFKGFENKPAIAACGTMWTSRPGNGAHPPAGPLPRFMAVIVASSIGQSGSSISGNTVHVVVVKTFPGYSPSPGHNGLGIVVAVIC